jgi:hypothetical protein
MPLTRDQRRRTAYMTAGAPRPKTLRCQWCSDRMKVNAQGRVPEFCSQSCRQRAHERRKWQRPKPVELLAQDVATMRVRNLLRAEIWAVLQEVGLINSKWPVPPIPRIPRRAPKLRLVEGPTDDPERSPPG